MPLFSERMPKLFAAFAALLLIFAGVAKFMWRGDSQASPESASTAQAQGTSSGAGSSSQPSHTSDAGYAVHCQVADAKSSGTGEFLPGGRVPVLAPPEHKLSPELDYAMDLMHAKAMADQYVDLLERGRTGSDLEVALVKGGKVAKEALGTVIKNRTLSATTMEKVRSTYDAIR